MEAMIHTEHSCSHISTSCYLVKYFLPKLNHILKAMASKSNYIKHLSLSVFINLASLFNPSLGASYKTCNSHRWNPLLLSATVRLLDDSDNAFGGGGLGVFITKSTISKRFFPHSACAREISRQFLARSTDK